MQGYFLQMPHNLDSLTMVHTTYTLFGIYSAYNLQVYRSSTVGEMGMYITVRQLVRLATIVG